MSYLNNAAILAVAFVLKATRIFVLLVRLLVVPVLVSFVVVFGELVLYFLKGVARIGRMTTCR